jgi:predicted flap endonuclease-1-like 5' DNA nuclease
MTDAGGTDILLYIILAAVAVALLAWLIVRNARRSAPAKQRILSERSGDERPYVRAAPAPSTGVADEMASAASDVVGDVLRVDTNEAAGPGDDLQLLKGCGPKLAARLNELGITRFSQLAGLSETEVALIDDRLGPFRGRVARDRMVEQACYLARDDRDGFEARFGKLGGDGAA